MQKRRIEFQNILIKLNTQQVRKQSEIQELREWQKAWREEGRDPRVRIDELLTPGSKRVLSAKTAAAAADKEKTRASSAGRGRSSAASRASRVLSAASHSEDPKVPGPPQSPGAK